MLFSAVIALVLPFGFLVFSPGELWLLILALSFGFLLQFTSWLFCFARPGLGTNKLSFTVALRASRPHFQTPDRKLRL